MTPTVSGRSAFWARSSTADKAKAEVARKSRRFMLRGGARVLEEIEFAVFGATEKIRDAIAIEVDGGGADVMAFDVLLHQRAFVPK